MNYAATSKEAVITYKANNMVLAIHSDASYLNKTQARSRAGGHFFMSSNTTFLDNNRAIHNTVQVIKAVMSSVVKAELAALHINVKFATPVRKMLMEMGHPQAPMPIQKDNSTIFAWSPTK